jgi:hypothetical protein
MRLLWPNVCFTYGGYSGVCFIPMYVLPTTALLVSQNSKALEQIPVGL